MKPLYVAFLWHMHQPIYKDPTTGRYLLPWVRLHALKGYTDIPSLSEKYPELRQTINFTPSLLVQLEDYLTNPEIKDDFLEVTRKPADRLNQEDKQFILKHFFMNNWERVIHPHARYNELFRKRGPWFSSREMPLYLKRFHSQDFLDLQVLFNLMWFGFGARSIHPRINELIQKTRGYTEEEKKEVLDLQQVVLGGVIPRLKQLLESGRIEITTTPFYHPIVPLLSKEKEHELGYGWQEDARWHLNSGRDTFERFFGRKPQGMWPSEGSVSEGAASLFAEAGIRWIATDEEILLHSLDSSKRDEEIYQPFQFDSKNQPVTIFFRDKRLSDLIGFNYQKVPAAQSVEDFIHKLYHIQETVSRQEGNHVVSIILDGENPWEFYPEGGKPFLHLLMERLSEDARVKTVTFSEYLNHHPSPKPLKHLYAGSWINHNFDIWHKHPEDLLAWKYLDETRKEVKDHEKVLSPEMKEKAWDEIRIAEGSDWFWWYGNEFTTETEEIFDYLFRAHLIQVYHLIKKRVPPALKNPIKKLSQPQIIQEPSGFIQPLIDGKVTSFYEWANAGLYQRSDYGGAMYQSETTLHALHYGFSLTDLFIRLDFSKRTEPEEMKECHVAIHIHAKHDFEIQFPFFQPAGYEIFRVSDKGRTKTQSVSGSASGKNILEVKIPFELFEAKSGDSIQFSVTLYKNDIRLEECPKHGLIQFKVPDKDFEVMNWSA